MNTYPSNEWNKITDDAVYFYTPEFYALDNFSAFTVNIWNEVFPTSEHAYQWKKFEISSPDIAKQILTATSPNTSKKIAEANKEKRIQNWGEIKVAVMEAILRAKLEQHEKVMRILLETEQREIIENSPLDDFWGIGPHKDGRNELGKLWMKLRAEASVS